MKTEELECFLCYILHFETFFIENVKDQKPVHIGIHILRQNTNPWKLSPVGVPLKRHSENMKQS